MLPLSLNQRLSRSDGVKDCSSRLQGLLFQFHSFAHESRSSVIAFHANKLIKEKEETVAGSNAATVSLEARGLERRSLLPRLSRRTRVSEAGAREAEPLSVGG